MLQLQVQLLCYNNFVTITLLQILVIITLLQFLSYKFMLEFFFVAMKMTRLQLCCYNSCLAATFL